MVMIEEVINNIVKIKYSKLKTGAKWNGHPVQSWEANYCTDRKHHLGQQLYERK